MCQVSKQRVQAIKAAARIYAADHDHHPCIGALMGRYDWCFELALTFIEECRAEMRPLGRESRCACTDPGAFRS